MDKTSISLLGAILSSQFFMRGATALFVIVQCISSDIHAQSLQGIQLGAPPSTLETISLKSIAREGLANIKISKFKLANGNDLSVTYDSKLNKILYIESDWNQSPKGHSTGLPSLTFGVTTLNDIRQRNGSNGFAWRQVAVQRSGDQINLFNAYEIQGKPTSIVVFVTVLSIPEYEAAGAERKKVENLARLHAIILATESYLDQIWGEEKVYDAASKSIPWPR